MKVTISFETEDDELEWLNTQHHLIKEQIEELLTFGLRVKLKPNMEVEIKYE